MTRPMTSLYYNLFFEVFNLAILYAVLSYIKDLPHAEIIRISLIKLLKKKSDSNIKFLMLQITEKHLISLFAQRKDFGH